MYNPNKTKQDVAEILDAMSMQVDDETGEIGLTPVVPDAPVAYPPQVPGINAPATPPPAPQPTPQHDWEKRFKDTQAALTRSQQDLKQRDAQVQALSGQVEQLAGKLDQFLSQSQNRTPNPSPLQGLDPYDLTTDPQKFESAISQLVEQRVQEQLQTAQPELGITPELVKELQEDLQHRRELQDLVYKYPEALSHADDIAKVLDRYPDMGITQAYEFLVDFGKRTQEQQGEATPDPNQPQPNQQVATPTPNQGEVIQDPSPETPMTAEQWAALAAARQSEVSSTGQPGPREVQDPADAVEMALEELYT